MVKFILQSIDAAMSAAFGTIGGIQRARADGSLDNISRTVERLDRQARRQAERIYGKMVPETNPYAGLSGEEIDGLALSSDWQKVGDDLRTAIEQYKSGQSE